jgi:lipoyl(octanoyl) transferase
MQVQQFDQLVPYHAGWKLQKEWVRKIDQGAEDQLILLQHPHTVTLGRGSHQENLLLSAMEYSQRKMDVVEIDRGGDVTYHGPGQLVGYPLIYLGEGGQAKEYLRKLEAVLIDALAAWGIQGSRKESYTGVWVGEEKIAAIGVKFNRARHRRGYITSHGFALNVTTDLSYFQTIVPCGIVEYGVTSLERLLAQPPSMAEVQNQVIESFQKVFAYTKTASCK